MTKHLTYSLKKEVDRYIAKTGRLNPEMLNLGCGNDILEGWINVDRNPSQKGKVKIHDLRLIPYPFRDSSVDIVLMNHVLEHFDNPIEIIDEIYRILRDGGIFIARVPHYSNAASWCDITHKRAFSVMTLRHFCLEYWCSQYNVRRWSSVSHRFGFWMYWYYPWNYIIEPIANIQPLYFENVFANLFSPFEIVFVLEKKEND
jgi:SAM-dependent methyltransferase